MLRVIFTSLTLLISAHAAIAQDNPAVPGNGQPVQGENPAPSGFAAVPPTDLQSGIGNYCIYENLIYSIGSPICIGKTSYICAAPAPTDVYFNRRGYWTAKPDNPQLLPAPCG